MDIVIEFADGVAVQIAGNTLNIFSGSVSDVELNTLISMGDKAKDRVFNKINARLDGNLTFIDEVNL